MTCRGTGGESASSSSSALGDPWPVRLYVSGSLGTLFLSCRQASHMGKSAERCYRQAGLAGDETGTDVEQPLCLCLTSDVCTQVHIMALVSCSSEWPGTCMCQFQHWKWATPIWTPLASFTAGSHAPPLAGALLSLRIGSTTIVSHPAELQCLLARGAQPSQRCELSLYSTSPSLWFSVHVQNPENSHPYCQTRFRANLHTKLGIEILNSTWYAPLTCHKLNES